MARQDIIVTIHGIRTDNSADRSTWQNDFPLFIANFGKPNMIHKPFSYGWLGPVNSWIAKCIDFVTDSLKLPRITRRVRIDEFKKHLLKVKEEFPDANIHIVAHSFGTFITREALVELSQEVSIDSVHFVGAILSAHLLQNEFNRIYTKGTAKRIFIWSSHNDSVVRYIALPPFGHLGYWGLITSDPEDRVKPRVMPYPSYPFYNHHTTFTHSGYFSEGAFYTQLFKDIEESGYEKEAN